MHCACLLSLDKLDQICGWTTVDWFTSSNENIELPETCMFCIDGCDWMFYWGGMLTVRRATIVSMVNMRTPPMLKGVKSWFLTIRTVRIPIYWGCVSIYHLLFIWIQLYFIVSYCWRFLFITKRQIKKTYQKQSNLDYSKCQGPQESFRIIGSSNDRNRKFSDIFGKARMLS